jgi:hypothetical protein
MMVNSDLASDEDPGRYGRLEGFPLPVETHKARRRRYIAPAESFDGCRPHHRKGMNCKTQTRVHDE